MNYLFQLIERAHSEPFTKGVKFQDYSLISSISIGAYILALIINGTIGVKTGKSTSDKYQLVITPPPWAFSIWGIIFTTTLIALIWSIHTVSWSLKTHLYFWLYCLTISVWILLWAMATNVALFFCNIVLLFLTFNIFLVWDSTLGIGDESTGTWLMRSVIAFQLGWTASAQCLNFCIFLVYGMNFTQKSISTIVWIFIAISHSTYLYLAYLRSKQYNVNMLLNFGGYLLSAFWAILGVSISYSKFLQGKQK